MAEIIGDLDELLGLVRRSARQIALDIVADAQRRAQQTQDRSDLEAQRIRAQILAVIGKEVAEERRRMLAQVALEVQRQRLLARQTLLDQVWAEAERQLRELPGQANYIEVLHQLAISAAHVLGQEAIVLAADPAGHDLVTFPLLAEWSDAAAVRFMRAEQPAPIWGGLLAQDVATRRQVDASFATRLALARAELREEVARVLGLV